MKNADLPLSAEFVHNIQNAFGAAGLAWLAELPSRLEQAARKWDLSLGEPFQLSYNYVCAAQRADGSQVVLKLGVPNRELISEMKALRLFNGDGVCRLLEEDEDQAMFLLERLRPGEMLAALEDDAARTEIAAGVMLHLWQNPPEPAGFIQLREWFAELNGLRPRYQGGTGPFPRWLVEQVQALLPGLFSDPQADCLLHGDLHHFNILSSGRGWLAIDPKGVIGPRGYEAAPFLLNPIPDWPYRPEALRQTGRRLSILSERLGLPRELLRDWGLCHTLLSAWWDLTLQDTGCDYALACADLLARASI